MHSEVLLCGPPQRQSWVHERSGAWQARGAAVNLWLLVAATIIGCYLLKLAGYLVPARALDHGPTRRLVELVPVALLAALVVVELLADGRALHFDGPRLAGFTVGAVAVWRRAPFLVVVVLAAAVAALLRLA